MPGSLKRLDVLFPERTLQEILAARPPAVHAVAPGDLVGVALQRMAQHDIGLVVVLEAERLVGVLSERDLAREAGRSQSGALRDLRVADLMVRDVATVDRDASFAHCLALMNERGARHLPVLAGGRVVAVISIRDLLREAVTHHAHVLAELERERLLAFQPGV